MEIFFKILFFLFGCVLFSSCKKSFLEEDYNTERNYEDYKTTAGLDGLSTGLYQTLKFHFNYEWAYSTTECGTDEFTVSVRTRQMYNSYDVNLNSLDDDIEAVWNAMYSNINAANIMIENVPLYYQGANRETRLGEGYFFRAFDYFKLVKQYGGVPIKLTQSLSVEYEFTRSTPAEVYAQIISDFTKAYEMLPATSSETGRLTKWAAAHFLAKAYLFRASELYSSWNGNTRNDDLQKVVEYANLVINSGNYILAADFRDLWEYTTPDGPNELNKEIILSAQFSDNVATIGRYGNQMHLYYPSLYQSLPGMQRDIPGDREFQRLRTTDYAIDVYDRVNDSRFWKSFKTRYNCNNPATAPVWTAATAPDVSKIGLSKFSGNDTGVLYIVNNAGDTRYTAASIDYRAPNVFVRYFYGQPENRVGDHGNFSVNQYVPLSKFMDGSRNSVAAQAGYRDGILARLAETYLIAAEAYGRLGDYGNAVNYINKVRDRAAYKAGEDRSLYADGGVAYKKNPVSNNVAYVSYSDRNTYFESNNLAVTTASTFNGMHLNSEADIFNAGKEFYNLLGAASQQDKFICFILNERSRELMGELQRWEDLARTKTLVMRATTFNDEARPDPNKHYLRPLPQSFLDAIRINNAPLTAAQKSTMQNPGY